MFDCDRCPVSCGQMSPVCPAPSQSWMSEWSLLSVPLTLLSYVLVTSPCSMRSSVSHLCLSPSCDDEDGGEDEDNYDDDDDDKCEN